MVEVITMPPVGYTAISQALENPRSTSVGVNGTPRFSQTRQARRKFAVSIHGIGRDMAGQGYIEQLRRRLDAQPPIVQIEVKPDGWHLAMDAAIKARGHGAIQWTYGGEPMQWVYTAQSMAWWYSDLTVTTGSDYGGNYIDVTVPTPNAVIAYPGEKVVQYGTTGRVMGSARSDANGNARIYVDTSFSDGIVQISPIERVYAYLTSMPPTSQSVGQGYTYDWSMTEVLPSDFASFEIIQPWR